MLSSMFSVSEEEAAAIRAVYEQRGELSAAVELRRRFPGITDNAQARECARIIAGWKPLLKLKPPRSAGAATGADREIGMSKRINADALTSVVGTLYPPPFDEPCRARERTRLGDAAGLTQYGVNLLRLPPGAWSSQRHWHAKEDEFVYVLSGEVMLVTDAGEEVLRTGDCAGFKAGDPDGHCLQNRGTMDATVLEIGSRIQGEHSTYSDIDMKTEPGTGYVHKDGTPYPKMTRRGPG